MARVSDFLERFRPAMPTTQEIGIGGFTFFARVRDSYKLSADSPVIPVENGSFVNDHIIRKPIMLSIEGDVSDLHVRANPTIRQFQRLQAEVGNLTSQYAPAWTQVQLSQVSALANDLADAVRSADALLDAGEQAIDFFGNRDTVEKGLQEKFLDAMEAIYFGGQLIAIDMPYRRHENMVITSFTASTDNEGNSTGFTIEAQQLQFADLQFVELRKPAKGTNRQTEKKVDKGAQEGKPVPVSFLGHLLGN